MITKYYASATDNSVDDTGRVGYYSGLASPAEWYERRELLACQLKWPLPIAAILLGCVMACPRIWQIRRTQRSAHALRYSPRRTAAYYQRHSEQAFECSYELDIGFGDGQIIAIE
jgi:hypothetical protein